MAESLPARGAWIEISSRYRVVPASAPSLPARGAWIEISADMDAVNIWAAVAPRTGSVD